MKTRKQIAEESHNELLKEIVKLNIEVRYAEQTADDKKAGKLIIDRERLQDRLTWLEKEERS